MNVREQEQNQKLQGNLTAALIEVKRLTEANGVFKEEARKLREKEYELQKARGDEEAVRKTAVILTHLLKANLLGASPEDGLPELLESL